MSENVPLDQQDPSREDWTRFSQGMWQLLRDPFVISQNANMCEAILMRHFASYYQIVRRGDREKRMRSFVRGYEGAAADVCRIIVGDEADFDQLPDENASEYELWLWARAQPLGVEFITMDFKLLSITVGRTSDRQRELYWWSNSKNYRPRVSDAEVIVAMIEGINNFVCVMPSVAFVESLGESCGIETLSAKAPVWCPLFMVHLSHLEEAMLRLTNATLGNRDYVNPTTNVRLKGWRPDVSGSVDLDPTTSNTNVLASFEGMMRLFSEIEASGCTVDHNPDAPGVHDFYIRDVQHGLLRTELKERQSLEAFLSECGDRSNPFTDRRLWHVLLLLVDGDIYAVTRDEVGDRGVPDTDFLRTHRFATFAHALDHIRAHADEARKEVVRAIFRLQPQVVTAGLPRYEVILDKQGRDPLMGFDNTQRLLPFLSHELNTECMRGGYGVCLPLGNGNQIGTHLLISHSWTEQDKQQFRVFGNLPIRLWDQGVSDRRCVVLRFLDCSPLSNRFYQYDAPFLCRRDHWKKGISGMKNVLLVGWIGDSSKDRFILMPSHFTAIGTDKDGLPEPQSRAKGEQFFQRVSARDLELADPKWGKASSRLWTNGFITTGGVDPHQHILRLHDNSLYQQLRDILESSGPTSIHRPQMPATNPFLRQQYHVLVRDVLETTWDYGYYNR